MSDLQTQIPSTPESVSAIAQSRVGGAIPGTAKPSPALAGEGRDFLVGAGVERAARIQPYERKPDDPIYRPLRIYTRDPAWLNRAEGQALVNVPYEPLDPGPVGSLFAVDNHDRNGDIYTAVELEHPTNLLRSGRLPSPSDHQFHQQMVYAVGSSVYAVFRNALGRLPAWGFDAPENAQGGVRLRLRPHAAGIKNAFYSKEAGEICFGYYRASDKVYGMNLPGQYVFTCLSHDVIAHEMTHALLDGLRAKFACPTHPDVMAFHEGFADMVAVLLHFSYQEVVASAISTTRGQLAQSELLTNIAEQFGHTTGSNQALRSAILTTHEADGSVKPACYDPNLDT